VQEGAKMLHGYEKEGWIRYGLCVEMKFTILSMLLRLFLGQRHVIFPD
jgi:hypothetical protein